MFDFVTTVVCGIGKTVIGVLAVFGGGFATMMLLSDTFCDGVGKAYVDAMNEDFIKEEAS